MSVIVQFLFFYSGHTKPASGLSLTAKSGAAERIIQADVNHAERTLCKKKQLQELCPFTSLIQQADESPLNLTKHVSSNSWLTFK